MNWLTMLKCKNIWAPVIITRSSKSREYNVKAMEEELQKGKYKEMRTYLANTDWNDLLKNNIST